MAVNTEKAKIDSLLAQAREMSGEGRLEEACDLLEQVLALDTNQHEALTESGMLLLKLKKFEGAMTFLESARAQKDNESLRAASAECFLRLGLIEDAIEQLQEILKVSPLHRAARLMLGMAFNELQRPGDALVQAEVDLRLSPQQPTAHLIKVVAMLQLGLVDPAIQLLKEIRQEAKSQESTEDEMALFQLATALHDQNCFEQALIEVDSILKRNKNHLETLLLKSKVLGGLGRDDECDAILNQLVDLTEPLPEPEDLE